jgi:hypothetical protein
MNKTPYSVTVILDATYGDSLLALPVGTPVWIVDSPPNRTAAQRVWAQRTSGSHLDGITTFKTREGASVEQMLLGKLDSIDLHHGTYSAEPLYTVLEVIGADVTEQIKSAMSAFGFTEFETTALGFRAVRPLPDDNSE